MTDTLHGKNVKGLHLRNCILGRMMNGEIGFVDSMGSRAGNNSFLKVFVVLSPSEQQSESDILCLNTVWVILQALIRVRK